ncbi:elongation of very long chain fatty acids protein 1-like [Stomoxys calcitrans]|uniref:Elongation of very long chain fatty acids protein n=1 Tax=Stomoxys calcitrans TaxID=35570 RepID=A0A1I8Q2Q0_STOCA|nr:elongation of very long chain fatty acids protein 1-like [Stomoxys calcitrans]
MLILKLLIRELKGHFSIAGHDPRMTDLTLVNSYLNVILLLVSYVIFVKKIGPNYMAKQKAYKLKSLMRLYNIGQVMLNIYIFIGFMRHYIQHPLYNWLCMSIPKTDVSTPTMRLLHITYMCYMSKVLDLSDTVIFVLRKKNRQVSFLHVYHHVTMVWASFLYHNKFFGSTFTAIGAVNSFVHILMYTYYLLSAMDIKINLDAWKPRLTEIQIIQFCYYCLKFAATLLNNTCGMSVFWLSLLLLQNMFITLMFCFFYYKTYIVKERANKIR